MYRDREEDKLCKFSVTKEDVLEQISKLKANKSPGPDETYPLTLWLTVNVDSTLIPKMISDYL